MKSSLLWTLLLLLVLGAVAYTDMMLGHRKHVAGYSLGPAPFPDFKDMDYELFQDAFLRDDCVKVTDAEQVNIYINVYVDKMCGDGRVSV